MDNLLFYIRFPALLLGMCLFGVVALLTLLNDEERKSITMDDRAGKKLLVFGLVLVVMGMFQTIGTLMIALTAIGAVFLVYGGVVALPDTFTDVFLKKVFLILYLPAAGVFAFWLGLV